MDGATSHWNLLDLLHAPQDGRDWEWVLALVLTIAAVIATFASARGFRRYFAVSAVGFCVLALILRHAVEWAHWIWVLVLIPPGIVMQHAMFLGVVRRRSLTPRQGGSLSEDDKKVVKGTLEHVVSSSDRMFAPGILIARYGVPAVIMAAVGIAGASLLVYRTHAHWHAHLGVHEGNKGVILAALLGLVGAYIYVLLQLTLRSYRHDITPGLAMWCAVNLALGPVLAAALFAVWRPHLDPETGLTGVSIFLLCGLAPRAVANAVEQLLRKNLPGESASSPRNPLPLGSIQGLSANDEERLREEGIEDASTLAYADPFRLLRATPFDRRRLVDWMDRAHLMTVLPAKWKELEAVGITGIIDLAWAAEQADDVMLADLASKVGLEPAALKAIALRSKADAQVVLLWTLYQLDAGEDGHSDVPTISVRPPEPEEAPTDLGVEILLGAARRGFAAAILCAVSLGLAISYERPLVRAIEWPVFTVAMLVAAFVASGVALLWALVPSPDPLETQAIERRMQCAVIVSGVVLAMFAAFGQQAFRYAADGAMTPAALMGVPATLLLALMVRATAQQALRVHRRIALVRRAFPTP
jgi:hypothetical protein